MYEVEGCSIREIMRRTSYHYETIRKYLDLEDFNPPKRYLRDNNSLLDPLKPIIDKWLEEDLKAPRKQRHTAQRIYDRLQETHNNELEVKLRTVQYYVSKKKKELFAEKTKGYLPLMHPPGEAQVDFGTISYYDSANKMKEGKKLTEGFSRIINHFNIEAIFCNPSSGWEKGHVENKVGYERRNMFVPMPTILDFNLFNKKLLRTSEKDMQRKHYRKEKLISEIFLEDKNAMQKVNSVEFNVAKICSVKADKYGKIMFESNRYSASPKFAKEGIYIEITSDTISILDKKYNEIVTHKRIYDKNKESMDWLPYIELMSKRPTALKYTGFYDDLPLNWKKYLSDLDLDDKREALKTLNIILQRHDIPTAIEALEIALSNGVKDSDSVLSSYYSLTKKVKKMQPMKLMNPQFHVPTFKTNTLEYDALFLKGACK